MFIDIIKPQGNEKEMIKMAEKLGVKGLAILFGKNSRHTLLELQKETGIRLYSAGERNADITVADISIIKNKKRADALIGVTQPLKHSEYKELGKKGISICFPIAELISAESKTQHIENISRSIRLCRKHKTMIIAATLAEDPYQLRAEQEIRGLFLTLGMSTKQAKEAINGTNDIIAKKHLLSH